MEEERTQVKPTLIAPVVGPGKTIGNYRLEKIIGSGLSSEIYEARSLITNKRCSVKIFRREYVSSPVTYGRYVHESKRISQLNHPQIADIFSHNKADGPIFTVGELLEGTNLRTYVRQEAPLSRRIYIPVMRQICSALAAVHELGVIHGHLHPGQAVIRLSDSGPQIKLLDFGTRHLLPSFKDQELINRLTAEDAIYLAPEMVRGDPTDHRTDIYALSIMLYEMVTGRVPFLGNNFVATVEQAANAAPIPPSDLTPVPTEFEELIMQGIDRDPRKRPPSVEMLLSVLDPSMVTGQFQVSGKNISTTSRPTSPSLVPNEELTVPPRPATGSQPVLAQTPTRSRKPKTPEKDPAFVSNLPAGSPRLPLRAQITSPAKPKQKLWLFVLLGITVVGFLLALVFFI